MSKQALFDFLSDEYCRLMIDLSKFRLTEEEREKRMEAIKQACVRIVLAAERNRGGN